MKKTMKLLSSFNHLHRVGYSFPSSSNECDAVGSGDHQSGGWGLPICALPPPHVGLLPELVMDRLGDHLSDRPGNICLFNIGNCNLPERLLEAGARDVLILDSNKDVAKKWKELAKTNENACKAYHLDFIAVQPYSTRTARYASDTDVFNRIFGHLPQNPLVLQDESTQDDAQEPAAITCIGLVPPIRQRTFLQAQFHTLVDYLVNVDKQSKYRWSPVELWLFLTPSERCIVENRPFISKTARFWSTMYDLLFDIKPLGDFKLHVDSFSPKIVLPKQQVYLKSMMETELNMLYPYRFRPRKVVKIGDQCLTGAKGVTDLIRYQYFLSWLYRQKQNGDLLTVLSHITNESIAVLQTSLQKLDLYGNQFHWFAGRRGRNKEYYTTGKVLKDGKQEILFNKLVKQYMIDPLKEMKIGEEEELSHFNRSFYDKTVKSFCQLSPDDYAD